MIRSVSLGALCVCSIVATAPAQVTLRGGTVLDDTVVGVNGQGVVTSPRLAGDAQRVIPWDMVRAVEGDFAQDARAFSARADAAWRAQSRLARGDDRLAEPALAALYEELKGEDGPLTLRVSEGLLRCRLIRGDQAGAVPVWLTAVRLRGVDAGLPSEPRNSGGGAGGAGGAGDSSRAFDAVIDPETGLCPALPPLWTDASDAAALRAALQASSGAGGPAAELAQWYERAAALDAGEAPADALPAASAESDAVKLVSLMVKARDPDAKVRGAARERLIAGLDDDADTWKEAWRRAALGRSFLMESDATLRSQGLVHWLHLPARFARAQPYLAGAAVVEASNELKRRGDKASLAAAIRLVTELKVADPFHPALRNAGGTPSAAPKAESGAAP
ncbi:MAG: hypothetical protein ACKVZJ_00650 [Phycisphaerales bacterium]